VPLSEEEQRMLEQLEQALAAEDPKFASTLRGRSARSHHRRVAIGSAVGFVAGIVLLMTGVIIQQVAISVGGFLLMLGGAYFGLTAYRRSSQPEPLYVVGSSDKTKSKSRTKSKAKPKAKPAAGPRQRPQASGSFMERLEERWRRRRESGF
jgi:F0F1-type ATP synthase assembly protein I